MTAPRLLFTVGASNAVATPCSWCLTSPATLIHQATPACTSCQSSTPRVRVQRWLDAVKAKRSTP